MLRSTGTKGRMLVLAGLAVAAAAGALLFHSQALLSHGFGKALQSSRSDLSFTGSSSATANIVGDEGYWLTRAEVQSPSPFAKALAVGDRITISGSDGRERRLEVVDLKAMHASGTTPMRLVLVTCRVSGEGAPSGEAPVRFIVEGEPAAPLPAASAAKAL